MADAGESSDAAGACADGEPGLAERFESRRPDRTLTGWNSSYNRQGRKDQYLQCRAMMLSASSWRPERVLGFRSIWRA
jgi:hypothetical protein